MAAQFKVGEKVSWNSQAGRTFGTIKKIHTKDFDFKGRTHRATESDPQYEVESGKTGHIAAHKGTALNKD